MRRVVTGEQVAQIYNPDPFARPVFRAPVYQTPAGIIVLAWLARFLFRLLRLAFRHPVAANALALLAFLWFTIGWIGLSAMTAWAVLVLVIWRCFWPSGFARWAAAPARSVWRARCYRRRWHAVDLPSVGLAGQRSQAGPPMSIRCRHPCREAGHYQACRPAG